MAKNDFGPWPVVIVRGLIEGRVSVVENNGRADVHLSAMQQGINLPPERVLEISKILTKAAKIAMKYEKERNAA